MTIRDINSSKDDAGSIAEVIIVGYRLFGGSLVSVFESSSPTFERSMHRIGSRLGQEDMRDGLIEGRND